MNCIRNHENAAEHANAPPFWRSRYGIGLLVFGAIAAYFLLTEHLALVVGALPLLILLACPLMHVFMHHGHGGHGHGHGNNDSHSEPPETKQAKPAESS